MIMTTSTTKAACPTNSPKGPVPVTPRSNETRPGHTTRLPQKTRPGHTTRLSQTNSPKGSVTVTLRTRSKERCSQVRPHEFKTGPHSKLRRANWRPLLWPTTTMTAALLLLTLSPVTGAGEKFMTWDFTNKTICMIKEKCLKRNGGCDGVGRVSKTEAGTRCPKCHKVGPLGLTLGYVLTNNEVEGKTMKWIKDHQMIKPRVVACDGDALPVPPGWESAVDPASGGKYYWKTNAPENTQWENPYNLVRYLLKEEWSDGFLINRMRFFIIPKSYDETGTENGGKGKRRLTGQEILDLRPRRKNSAEVVLGALLEEITRR